MKVALFVVNVLIQRLMNANQPVYVNFLDYNRAFDKVHHNHLKKLLIDININKEKYQSNNTSFFYSENVLSEVIDIKCVVRQGSILSLLLFSLYSEDTIQEALEGQKPTMIT